MPPLVRSIRFSYGVLPHALIGAIAVLAAWFLSEQGYGYHSRPHDSGSSRAIRAENLPGLIGFSAAFFFLFRLLTGILRPGTPAAELLGQILSTACAIAMTLFLWGFHYEWRIVFSLKFFLLYGFLAAIPATCIDVWRFTRRDGLKQISLPSLLRAPFAPLNLVLILFCGSLLAVDFLTLFHRSDRLSQAIYNFRASWNRTLGEWCHVPLYPPGIFREPMDLVFLGDEKDEGAYLLLDRRGRVWRHSLQSDPQQPPELVVDCSSIVGSTEQVEAGWGAENGGALSLALHPDFDAQSEGRLFVYFCYYDAPLKQGHSITERYTHLFSIDLRPATPPERLATKKDLIRTMDPQEDVTTYWHSGGGLDFGPDGCLYLGVGDCGTPQAAQEPGGKLRGLLRIDIDQRGGTFSSPIQRQPTNGTTQDYFIPNDNPFVGEPDILPELYAVGIRNPFRIHIDQQTGDIWIGNVGQNSFEEIEIARKGTNHQWPSKEGPDFFAHYPKASVIFGHDTDPAFSYAHSVTERSVIVGPAYTGDLYPQLHGKYLYGDTISGSLFALASNPDGEWDSTRLTKGNLTQGMELVSIEVHDSGRIFTIPKNGGTIHEFKPGKQKPLPSWRKERPVAELYMQHCSICHGTTGAGMQTMELTLGRKMADFTSKEWQASRSDEQIIKIIQHGGKANGMSEIMPPWNGILDKKQVIQMKDHTRGLGR